MIYKLVYFLLAAVLICANTGWSAVIEGGVSMTDAVPKGLYGSWLVKSECINCSDRNMFETSSVDIWILTRTGSSVVLANPATGARAEIDVKDVKGNTVKFEKRSFYPDEESYETPILTLHDDKFEGIDKIIIKTFKNKELISEEYVEYRVRGEKISGVSARGIFSRSEDNLKRASKGVSGR